MRYLVKRIPSTSLVHYDGSRYYCEIAGGTAEKATVDTADLLSGSKYLDVQTGNWYVYDELSNSWALSQEGGSADPAVIEQAVTDWLDAHPEATTTVADGSITEAKLASALAQKVNQVTSLSDEIDGIKNEIGVENLTLTLNNGYVTTSGTIDPSTTFRYSAPVPVLKGQRVILNARGYRTTVAMISTSDANGANIVPQVISDGGTVHDYSYDVANDGYVVFSWHNGEPYKATLHTEQANDVISNRLSNAETLEFLIGDHGTTGINGYCHYKTGAFAQDTTYTRTDFLSVFPHQEIIVNTHNKSNDACGCCFYDKTQHYISGFNVAVEGHDKTDYTVEVPENAYYFVYSAKTNDGYKFSESYAKYSLKQSLLNVGNNAENVDYWGLCMSNVYCIGDSLTQGAYYTDSTHSIQIPQQWTYPSMLKRILRLENVVNGGHGGWDTKRVWSEDISLKNTELGNYDSFIIWLGTNGGFTDTLSTDVDAFNNYTDYADTETGSLCKIIEHIRANNSSCFIALCNLFTTTGTLATSNDVIQQIATKYSVPVIDMTDMYNARSGLHHGIDNPHFGKAGNIFVANRIAQSVSDYINDDPIRAEFYILNAT